MRPLLPSVPLAAAGAIVALLAVVGPAAAEVQLSFYGGWAGAPDGGVTVTGEAPAPDRDVSLDGSVGGNSQAGLRATWWGQGDFGVALDYSRFGDAGEGGEGLSFGEYSTLTVSGMARWQDAFAGVTPYVGAGVGLATAEIEADGESVEATGPAVSWVAGASYPIGGNWSVFGEYEGTYVDVEGDTAPGGTLESETVTNSINLGVSFSF